MNKTLEELGFINKEGSSIVGCKTIPCMQGKMPFDEGGCVPCAIIQSMCSISPYEQVTGEKYEEKKENVNE